MAAGAINGAKRFLGWAAQGLAAKCGEADFHLATAPSTPDGISHDRLRAVFDALPPEKQGEAYQRRWELAKKDDATIAGDTWGQDHFWDDHTKVARVLHRMGLLGSAGVVSRRYFTGLVASGPQYFSLGEKQGKNPRTGEIGVVNGMGMSLKDAGSDAARFSDLYTNGNDCHCVHLPSNQDRPVGDFAGFVQDAFRMLSVEGGGVTKTALLITEQWIDYLDANSRKNFLQACMSEGTVHVNAALQILRKERPDLLARLRILAFCPAHVILTEESDKERGLQVRNIVKKEDGAINPWGSGSAHIGSDHPEVLTIPHTTGDNPHNFLSADYVAAGKPLVFEFMRSGNLY